MAEYFYSSTSPPSPPGGTSRGQSDGLGGGHGLVAGLGAALARPAPRPLTQGAGRCRSSARAPEGEGAARASLAGESYSPGSSLRENRGLFCVFLN